MIRLTYPEPRSDLIAQLAALADPAHPKRVMWVAAGGVRLAVPSGLYGLERPEGTLIALDPWAPRWLAADPSEATLAILLGYPEDKDRALREPHQVVQALDPAGAVITESLCRCRALTAAIAALQPHGRIRLTTPDAVIARRCRLSLEEGHL